MILSSVSGFKCLHWVYPNRQCEIKLLTVYMQTSVQNRQHTFFKWAKLSVIDFSRRHSNNEICVWCHWPVFPVTDTVIEWCHLHLDEHVTTATDRLCRRLMLSPSSSHSPDLLPWLLRLSSSFFKSSWSVISCAMLDLNLRKWSLRELNYYPRWLLD